MDFTLYRKSFNKDLEKLLRQKVKGMTGLLQAEEVLHYVKAGERVALAGGKRARPMMAESMYFALGGKDKTAARHLGLGLELFHLFCLIHDDIIDGAGKRHGVATVHSAKLTDKEKQVSQAILVGDLFFGWAYEQVTLAASRVKHGAQVLAVFAKLIDEVIAGQMLDVDLMKKIKMTEEHVERKNMLKTATYSFIRPLELGHALVYADKKLLPVLRQFGAELGTAFQLQDDMMDLFADPKVTGKSSMTDIADGAHTPLSAFVFNHASKNDRAAFQKIFGQGPVSAATRKAVLRILSESGALHFAEERLTHHFALARKAMEQRVVPSSVRGALVAIHEYIEHRQK